MLHWYLTAIGLRSDGQAQMNNNDYNDDYTKLCDLADSMAQAATTFNGHGYWTFLQARQEFQQTLQQILDHSIF